MQAAIVAGVSSRVWRLTGPGWSAFVEGITVAEVAYRSLASVYEWLVGEELCVLYALVGEKEGSDQLLKDNRIRGAAWPWTATAA